MTGYTNANGDDRGVLDRYLPTPYRKTGSGTEVHNAFLGAIKNSIISTEKDLIENVKQVYITNATGKLLDLYGKWIGLTRKGSESDDTYRNRLLSLIVTERVTVKGIIAGIKADLDDPNMDVSIYEPWRNIFILNQSLLNGPDHLMGSFYRYAVIQVTLSRYVPQDTLNKLLKNYKAAGIQVYFVLSSGMTYTGDVLSVPISLAYQGRSQTSSEKVLSNYSFGINDLPVGALNKGIFTTNISKLNSSDVLAGSPENTYAYQYGTAPSKNIFGLVDKGAIPESYTDPYDYVYQGTKVDLSTVGGRNLLLNTEIVNSTSNLVKYANSSLDASVTQTISFPTTGEIKLTNSSSGEMYYRFNSPEAGNLVNLKPGGIYTFSASVKGDVPELAFRWQLQGPTGGWFGGQILNLNITSDYHRATATFTVPSNATAVYTSIQGYNSTAFDSSDVANGKSFTFKEVKIEEGNQATDWTPAPEDTPKTYIYPYKNSSYVNMGRKDGVVETLTNSSKRLVFALNVKDYLISKGYGDSVTKINQSSITGIVLSTIGSPYGISATTFIAHKRTDNSVVTGKWYDYTGNKIGALIGSYIPRGYTSSHKFLYKLDEPSDIATIETSDYYGSEGANRSIQVFDGSNYVRVFTTKAQTLGTISIPVLSSLNERLLSATIKSITSDITNNNYDYLVYNYSKSSWDSITSATNIYNYLKDGAITGGTYVLLSTVKTGNINVDFAGLNITCYN